MTMADVYKTPSLDWQPIGGSYGALVDSGPVYIVVKKRGDHYTLHCTQLQLSKALSATTLKGAQYEATIAVFNELRRYEQAAAHLRTLLER